MKRLALLVLLLFATPAHATVNEVFARNEYVVAASGTVFPYTFKILDKVQITVMVNGVIKNLDTDYSVSGVGDSGGGAVTFVTTPGDGASVVLIRDQPVQQLSTYTANEAFPATRLMNDLDKNIMVDQMQQEEIGRALKFDPYSLFKDVFIDTPVAGKCLAWNSARTRVINADCAAGGGGGGELPPGLVTGSALPGQATFWSGANTIAGDTKFLWDNSTKALTVGTTPLGGPLKPGNVFIGLQAPSDSTGMQALMVQTYQGAPGLAGLVTLGDDRVGISSWNFRGTGATNPIYGANFGVVFNTPGVANGLEIDVQNDSTTNYIGQALWLNGSTRATGTPGTVGHRANAILIDTQDGSKWERGILFKEGFIGGGATGSIEKMGIHFEHSQDADFIVIQPRVGQSANIAMKLTNPEFTTNRFELLNSGAIRVGTTMTGPAFPSYAFVEEQTTGIYLESPSVLGFAISGPLVPGPGVGGFRRMTLGTALNIYPAEATSGNTGTLNLWDQFSAHSVGLMAPDFVGNSFRIRLPSIPGISGQCLITDGAFPISSWSYAACGTGGGGGGTVTNSGVLALNTLVLGDGGVAVKVMASPGTVTTVLHGNATPGSPPTFGPVVVADIGATGTPSATTFLRGDGTWSTLPGSGTVVTSGTPASGQVAFMTGPLAITSGPNLTWGGSGQLTLSGVASVEPPTGVENSIQSFVTTTDVGNFHFPLFLRAISTGQMIDGFGPAIAFSAADASVVNNSAGVIGFYRSGLDNTYSFGIVTYINGVAGERFRINGTGQAVYLPTLTVGNFSLAANLTRRTELQFHTNSNVNAVSFIAPATATGNHVWTLPSTFGAAGSLLSNDGTGTLSWVPGVTTSGTPVSGQAAFFTGATAISGDSGLFWNNTTKTLGIGTATPIGKLGVQLASASGSVLAWDNTYAIFGNAGIPGGKAIGIGFDSTSNFGEIRVMQPGVSFHPLRLVGRQIELYYQNSLGNQTLGMTLAQITGAITIPNLESGGTQCVQASSTGLLSVTGAACGGVTGSGAANRIGYWSGASTLTSAAGFTFDGAAMTIPGNLLATALTPDVSSSNPRLIVTEGASTPVGDVTAWRPYMRFILNNTATDRKSAIYIESINTGAPVSASRVNSGIQVFHASAQDNGGEVSGISSVEWLDGNAGTFQRDCRAVGSRPGSLPACVTSRAAGFSLEINGSGNMSNAISGSLDTTSTVISYAASVNSPGTGALQPAGFVAFTANDTLNLHLREAIRVMGTGLETTGAYSAAAVRFLVTMDGATRVGPSLANMGQGTINTSVGYYTGGAAPIMPSLAGASVRLVTASTTGRLGVAAAGFNGDANPALPGCIFNITDGRITGATGCF